MPYAVDLARVVHERIEGEVTVIDLHTGSYFGIFGAGVAVWDALVPGADRAGCVRTVLAAYDVTEDVAGPAVDELLARLLAAQLLVEAPASDSPSPPVAATDRQPWAAPELEVYTDMQDFLQLDPIHEVDPAGGWPKPAP